MVKQADIRNAVFLLDIDGTLNKSQEPLSDEMSRLLQRLTRYFQVYFVTGNNYIKTVDIINGSMAHFSGVFCNNGDELRTMRGKLMWTDTETEPLDNSLEYWIRVAGDFEKNNCVEWRSPRFVNVSMVGRFATQGERNSHDAGWRDGFIKYLRGLFNFREDVDFSTGGSVSVDIYSKGADKSRACKYINNTGKNFIFIGDRTDENGNDYPVKKYCEQNDKNICLTSFGTTHTMEIIEEFLRRI